MEWWQWLVHGTSALVAVRYAWFAARDFRRGEEMRDVGEHIGVAVGLPAITVFVAAHPIAAIVLVGCNLVLALTPESLLDKTLESGERRTEQLHE